MARRYGYKRMDAERLAEQSRSHVYEGVDRASVRRIQHEDGSPPPGANVQVLVKNASGESLPRFSVLTIRPQALGWPGELEDVSVVEAFNSYPLFRGVTPLGDDVIFCVIQEPAAEDQVVPAVIQGLTIARFDSPENNGGGGYATPEADEYWLKRSGVGEAKIIWPNDFVEDSFALVLLGGQPDTITVIVAAQLSFDFTQTQLSVEATLEQVFSGQDEVPDEIDDTIEILNSYGIFEGAAGEMCYAVLMDHQDNAGLTQYQLLQKPCDTTTAPEDNGPNNRWVLWGDTDWTMSNPRVLMGWTAANNGYVLTGVPD